MDVFVHPAIAESFGMAIIDVAMARPILSTPVDRPRGDRATGDRIAVLVLSARRVGARHPGNAGTPDVVADDGAAAHGRVQEFTATSMANRYQELYAQWLGEA